MSRRSNLDQLVGERVGGYVIEDVIGAGGQAAVFKVHSLDVGPDAVFALKIFGIFDLPGADLKTGLEEARTQAKVEHPSVVNFLNPDMDEIVVDGEKRRVLLIPMPIAPLGSCDGKPIFGNKQLTAPDYKSIVSLLDGLRQIHNRRLIHNDIKPANILRFEQDIAGENRIDLKITDFGMSKVLDAIGVSPAARSGLTPQFMAPERIEKGGSAKTDIYSMGASLYYMITGKLPISDETYRDTGSVILRWTEAHNKERRPYANDHEIRCPPRLALLIVRMMSVDPKDRPGLSECIEEVKKTREIEHGRKFEFKIPESLADAMGEDFPIHYRPKFPGYFWPKVHHACGNSLFVLRMKMPHPVFEQYRRLLRFAVRFYLDCFNLFETWGTFDVNMFVWSPRSRFEDFVRELSLEFPRAEPSCAVAGVVHHFHQPEPDSSVRSAGAVAMQEGLSVQDLERGDYVVDRLAAGVRRRSIRAFTYVESTDGGDESWRRGGIINHVREMALDLQRNDERFARISMFELSPAGIGGNAFNATPVMVDYQATNYQQLPDVPTRVIALGAHTVRTTTCLETRRVLFQSGKILL